MREGKRPTAFLAFAVLIAALVFAPATVRAEIYELQSGNSTVTVDTEADFGMFQWAVNGVHYMNEQRFFYRVGDSAESPLDSLDLGAWTLGQDSFSATLYGQGFRVDVILQLFGGDPGTGAASLGEYIAITNTSGDPLDLHLFQYADFDMGGLGQSGNDMVEFVDERTVAQRGTNGSVSETIQRGFEPYSHQAGNNLSMWGSLTDDDPTTLSGPDAAGPDNVAWAFQWDLGDQNFLYIQKFKQLQIVPAPGAAVLAVIGLSLVAWAKRRSL